MRLNTHAITRPSVHIGIGPSWGSYEPLAAILFRTPTQVNAKALLREVHAAEERKGGMQARAVASSVEVSGSNWQTTPTLSSLASLVAESADIKSESAAQN